MKINVTLPDDRTVELNARNEWTLMEAMRDGGLGVRAQCGGGRACATCHVHIAPDWFGRLAAPDEEETELLEDSDSYDPAASRLSCQIVCTDALEGLSVTLQDDSWEN